MTAERFGPVSWKDPPPIEGPPPQWRQQIPQPLRELHECASEALDHVSYVVMWAKPGAEDLGRKLEPNLDPLKCFAGNLNFLWELVSKGVQLLEQIGHELTPVASDDENCLLHGSHHGLVLNGLQQWVFEIRDAVAKKKHPDMDFTGPTITLEAALAKGRVNKADYVEHYEVARTVALQALPFPEQDEWDDLMSKLEREVMRASDRWVLLGRAHERKTAHKPKWDRDSGELLLDGEVIRRVKSLKKAKNIVAVLDAFEEEHWQRRIDDPLPGGRNQKRLHETVKRLNDGLEKIRFRADGSGEGFKWERVSPP
jgi:hypothetical protein